MRCHVDQVVLLNQNVIVQKGNQRVSTAFKTAVAGSGETTVAFSLDQLDVREFTRQSRDRFVTASIVYNQNLGFGSSCLNVTLNGAQH
jgi:hypothetical protein